jgi:glucokinase
VPRFGDFFAASPFRDRFEAKGRFSAYLRTIRTYVITAENPTFRGLIRVLDEA